MLIPSDKVNILNIFSVMIIFILLLFLTNLHLKLLRTQGIGADKLLSTKRVMLYISEPGYQLPVSKLSVCLTSAVNV